MSLTIPNFRINPLVLTCSLLLGASQVVTAEPYPRDLPEGSTPLPSTSQPQTADQTKRPTKTVQVSDFLHTFKNRIDLKFTEGSGIRLRQGHLTVLPSIAKRTGADEELQQLLNLLQTNGQFAVSRMHTLPENDLETMKQQGEKQSGQALSDLNLWFYLYVDTETDQELALLLNRLNALTIVETANASILPAPAPDMDKANAMQFNQYWQEHNRVEWPKPEAAPPSVAPATKPNLPESKAPLIAPGAMPAPPLAISYVSNQDYREAAPIGIDINYVNSRYYAADGWNWGYTDVEYSWNKSHSDLSKIAGNVYANGTPNASATPLAYRNHGTAVVGMLSSDSNSFGTTGLVSNASVRLSTEWPTGGFNPAQAITAAASQYWKGSVILLEMQTWADFDCNGTDGSDAYIPIEQDAASKAAIQTAVANGRIVVEAAGNGNCDLDQAGFNGNFNPSDAAKDSGAIIVGAGEKLTRNKASFSTYGSRVDTHGEGDWQIYTTGYGDFYSGEGENLYYTAGFSGTSGASPAITGAAVSLSSILWEYHGSFWGPKEIREVLRREGTSQKLGGHIGPRPDLRKQVESITNRHLQMHSADFDGDGKTDYAVFRPNRGTWYIRYASGGTNTVIWGRKGDIPAPADVTGDGRAELIVFRPSNGTWYINSWDPLKAFRPITWGQNGDLPVPLDYNGDGKAELAVYRRRADSSSRSHWYIRNWNKTTVDIIWGEVSDTPIARDMDGDKRDDLVVFRGTTGQWWIRYSDDNTSQTIPWGIWGDIPLTYRDSLGRWNIAVWRPSDSKFYARNINTGATGTVQWGEPGDIPRFGDTDGNGWDEYIIWRPRTGVWWNLNAGTQIKWGAVGDIAISR